MNSTNLETAAFLLSLLCIFYMSTVKRKQYHFLKGHEQLLMNQHFVFFTMLVSTAVSSVASVTGVYLQNVASENFVFWQYLFHTIYFLFHNALPICFALYIMHVNGSSAGRSRRFFVLFFLPFLFCELMIITNSFTKFVFYMDDQFVYHRGSLILVNYIWGLLYFVYGFFLFFRYKRAISKTDSHTIGILLSISAVGIIVQALNSGLVVELFAESLTLVGLLLMLEERGGHVDPVTGALNRVALIDDSRRLIENGQSCRIVLVKLTDIDLFSKLFNGREMDSILLQVSEWLTTLSSEQSFYNYRSNDFALLYHEKDDKEANEAVDRILKRFEMPWKTGEASFRLETAVSVLRIPEDINSLDELTEVLTSGYRKTGIGSRLVPYDELFANQRSRKIEQALRDAVDSNKLRLFYQPIWSVDEGRTVAAEALLRIDGDALHGISPEIYIPIAEQCGIIRDIGLFVFEDVCRFLKETKDSLDLSYIELNLSVHQFIYDDLVDRFESIRKQYGIPTDKINLEITESASTRENPVVEQAIDELRGRGYSFSLDDFGTGYSTVMQFISNSYKNVKIDKSLLWESDHNEISAKLLDTLIHVIRSLGCNVVQEGVETLEQLERTEQSGGNLIQGYYFSKPISESDFIAYIKKESAAS